MKWTLEDEIKAKEEYLSMISAFQIADEFAGEWKGQWDNFEKETFTGKKVNVKGDKEKYMNYWIENQKIINDNEWNNITNDNEYF
jgi:hypothetical protein